MKLMTYKNTIDNNLPAVVIAPLLIDGPAIIDTPPPLIIPPDIPP